MKVWKNVGQIWSWLSFMSAGLFGASAQLAHDDVRAYIHGAFALGYMIAGVLFMILWELKQQGKILRGEFNG